jgi:WD40 repeat protein
MLLLSVAVGQAADATKPIEIAAVKHEGPVSFEKEILPILTKNCLACHNTKKAESSLVLETPSAILKGGDSGPAAVAGNGSQSLLLKAAAHLDDTVMPPADNNVGAVALSSEQLGLVKLWIDEGARGTSSTPAEALKWQELPPGVNPVYAVALTPDAEFAACGRANQIFVYHLGSGKLVTRLSDPRLLKTQEQPGGVYQTGGVAHLDLVQSLAFSPDGERLASGSYREVKLWRRPQNVRRADLAAGAAAVDVLALSPDGKWAALGEAGGAIKLWDVTAAKEVKAWPAHAAAVTGLRFLPGGSTLVSTSLDHTIRAWNVPDGSAKGQVEAPAPVRALAVLSDETQIATGGDDNLIRLWTLPTESPGSIAAAGEITGHGAAVTALATLPTDKTALVSASADGTVRFWNLANKQQVREIKHGAAVTALAVRGDGAQLASAGADNLIKLWNAADGAAWAAADKQPIAAMKGDSRSQFRVNQLARALATVTSKAADAKQAVTDAETKIITASATVTTSTTAKAAAAKTLTEKTAAVKAPTDAKAAADKELAAAVEVSKVAVEKVAQAKAAAAASAQNAELAKATDEAAKAAAEADKKVKELEKKVQDASAALTKAMGEATTAEAANMAAEQAASAAVAAIKKAVTDVPLVEQAQRDVQALLAKVQADSDAAKKADADTDKPVRTLTYSADGAQLLSAGDNALVRTWSSDRGAPVDTYEGHKGPVLAAMFLADGSILSSAGDNSTILWNTTPDWTLERTIGSVDDPAALVDRVIAISFSPDGKLLATGGGEPSRSGELKIWNVADGALVKAIPDAHSDTIFGLEFSPDGVYLASSAADRFVKVFNVASGSLYKSFEGHTHHVLDVTWKSDGKVLASCGADNVIKVWDFVTGDQRRTIAGFTKEVTSIGFVGATSKVVASSGDKTVKLLNTDNGAAERAFAGPGDFMYSIATSADGRIVIAGGQESTLFAWLVDNGQLARSFEAPKPVESKSSGN